MKLLLLGGPRFLGRAVTDAAVGRGHELTFFNRGRTNLELSPGIEKLHGDRAGDLGALTGRTWDAVVDTSGYLPDVVRSSGAALATTGRCCFVSSFSVYADFRSRNDEASPVAELGALPRDEVTSESYGALKALCEDVVRDAFDGRALVIRPGLIVGPNDPTGRFTYWPHRVARGGEILAPGPRARRTQLVDVRDLAEWTVSLLEREASGTFNAAHPGVELGDLLETCRDVSGSEASVTWVTDEFLVEQEVGEWMELPLWLADPAFAALDDVDVSRALAAGLAFRPLEDTVRGTIDEACTVDGIGLAPEREAALLEAWHGR